jgi:hypothetical protein
MTAPFKRSKNHEFDLPSVRVPRPQPGFVAVTYLSLR